MKKTYVYFIVPVVLTAIFAVFYAKYASQYEAKIAQMEENKSFILRVMVLYRDPGLFSAAISTPALPQL